MKYTKAVSGKYTIIETDNDKMDWQKAGILVDWCDWFIERNKKEIFKYLNDVMVHGYGEFKPKEFKDGL